MELSQVMTALRNADAAGDTQAASRLAQIAKGMMGDMGDMGGLSDMQPKPAEGIGAALKGGFKRYGSSLETALESIIDPQRAAERGLQRSEDISKQYAPGASLERVKQKYEAEGLFPAAREAIGQIPAALVEQAPNMATALGGARLGAMAGAPIGGPVGALIGGGIGAAAAALPQLYASNLERQAQEGKEVERSTALAAAAPGAAAEVASQFIPLGRGLIGKILGPTAEKALAKGTDEAIERAAKESLLASVSRGAGVGLLAEIPTEVSQQMLERLQAGLPITTPDALSEYGEAAYGAALVGGPFGAAGRALGRPAARAEFEARQQQQVAETIPPAPEVDTGVTQMPGGYSVQRAELTGGMAPQTFDITMPDADKPLASFDTEEEAQKKLQSYTEIRETEREKALKEIEGINEGVQKMQLKLDQMEATGQVDTEEYKQLKANLPSYMENAAQKSEELHNKIETYGKPLQIVPVGEKQQVQETFKLLDKSGQMVQEFPTLGEAEARVKEIVGEQPFKQAQQRSESIKALEQQLVPAMQKFGLKDVALKVVDKIERGAGGAYLNKLIRVAVDEENPMQTMRHESVHALKDLGFFTPQQWKALEERAKKEWIKTHLESQPYTVDGVSMTRLEGYKKIGLSEDAIIEEAIADAFAAYDKGATPPPGLIAQLFKRLKQFFANLGQAVRGAGFQSADDIFQSIERGELKPSLKGAESAKTGEIKYSKAPEGVPQKLWDLHEKSMAADEAASGYNVGPVKANATKASRRLLKAVADHVGDDDQAQIALMVKMNEESNRRGEGWYGTTRFSFKPSSWKATKADIKQAEEYEQQNGILPYTSEGQLDVPLEADGTKYSIKMPYEQKAIERSIEKAQAAQEAIKAGEKGVKKVKVLKNDPITGLPLNQNGTVTLYYPTTNEGAREVARSKKLKAHSPTANRIYLTNESGANIVADNPGMIDQPVGGANVLLQVDPSLLNLVQEYDNGRKDFFIPIAEGQAFAKKMKQTKLFTLNAPRSKGLHPDRTLAQVQDSVEKTVEDWKKADSKERAALVKDSKALLMREHNVTNLFGANAKLEKTNIGEYGLTYNGKKVISTGLGFASAQRINDEQRASTCAKSAICEALCLGETSGQNELYGGEGPFRSGPRLSQFLKTEAFVVNPEAFTVSLINQLESFRKAAQNFKDEDGKSYYPSVRLNVTSDFPPKMMRPIIELFPDVMFYDYTKLETTPIGPNHHLTYSSTGASQVVNGEVIFNKESNWDRMVNKILSSGRNVAMAFSSRDDMPKFVKDERTGQTFEVWNGDEYDARFLDPKRPDGVGMIVGLTNKDRTTAPEDSAKKHNGFFLDYDKERDGDTLVIRNQAELAKDREQPVSFTKQKYSLKTSFPTAKEAEDAAYEKAPPATPEFKRFFGASKIMDEGRPQVMYHASPEEINAFRENKPIFVSPNAKEAEYYGKRHRKEGKMAVNIYPLWVRAETPFDYENRQHVMTLKSMIDMDSDLYDAIRGGDWETIESSDVQEAIRDSGFDSFYVREGDTKNLAVFSANQVKSATGNIGEFSLDTKDMRYSLPSISQGAEAAIGRVTTTRESKGFMDRILGALSPDNYTYLRQQALNRYESLAVADKLRAQKMGGAALLADQSAESAALMSDLHSGVAASVFGIQGRRGGVPVLRNGVTTVDHSKKGLIEVLSPLAKYGDPKVYQYFQFYSAVKRGARLFAEGRERLITPADQQHANELLQKFPEFEAVRKDWVAFNDAVGDYQVQAGVLSAADAQRFKQYADYIPFYRQLDGENTLGPNIFQSLSGVKKPKTLKGGEAPLADFMETIVRNTHAAITAGMKNLAEQQIIKVGKDVGIIHDIQPGTTVSQLEKIKVLINGVQHEYQCTDQLFAESLRSLHMPDLPFMSFLSAPANLLRNMITREPGFIMTNLLRDSLSAYVTSGANITPIAGTVINFGKAMKGNSPAFEALMDSGIIGGYEFSANIEQSGERLTKDLMKKAGKGPAVLKPFTTVWDGLETATTASDAATRMAVYERVLAETGNEAEALSRALEVMNFNRKGSSAVVRILTAAVPFLNARMQGLDLFYRAMSGKMNTQDAKEIQAKFFTRGLMMLGLSTMYYFAVAGDPEYEKQEQETKDNNWIITSAGIRIPIPFEVGILFKTIPERIAAYAFGNDTGKDFLDAMHRAANGFIPVSPAAYIPQTFKPIIEAMTNYSFFTQREIVGMGLKDVAPEYQVGPGTSAFAEFVGKTLGLSPIKVDHVFKGYTGTMGMYAVDLMDVVMDVNGDSPKPTKRFEQLPIIKRFAVDPEARGNVTNYYQLKDSVDTAVRTMNLLERSGDPKEFAKYVQDNVGLLAVRGYVNDLEKSMKQLRDMKKQVQNSPMDGDQKRDTIMAIGQAENNLSANIQTVKLAIDKIKP